VEGRTREKRSSTSPSDWVEEENGREWERMGESEKEYERIEDGKEREGIGDTEGI
jgi:hypothetical protein